MTTLADRPGLTPSTGERPDPDALIKEARRLRRRRYLIIGVVLVAVVGGVNYLLTWNCVHLADAQLAGRMQEVTSRFGWRLPAICTPEELMGD